MQNNYDKIVTFQVLLKLLELLLQKKKNTTRITLQNHSKKNCFAFASSSFILQWNDSHFSVGSSLYAISF